MTTRIRPLGKRQRIAIRALRDPRFAARWYPGCGWLMTNVSSTERVLRSLVRLGYAVEERRGYSGVVFYPTQAPLPPVTEGT